MANSENCPECGEAIIGNSDRCESCQTVFWKYIAVKQNELEKRTRSLAEKRRRASRDCPKCGVAFTDDNSECQNCGIIVEKFLTKTARDIKEEKQYIAEFAEGEKKRKLRREKEHRQILEAMVREKRQQGNNEEFAEITIEAEPVPEEDAEENFVPRPEPEEDSAPQKWKDARWKEEAKERWKTVARQKSQTFTEENTVRSSTVPPPPVREPLSRNNDEPPQAQESSNRQRIRETRERERIASQQIRHRPERSGSFEADGFTSKIVLLLKIGGWLWLVAGILSLVYSLFNGESILIGITAFLQGGFGCILFLAVGGIAEKVARIAERLED